MLLPLGVSAHPWAESGADARAKWKRLEVAELVVHEKDGDEAAEL